MDGEGHISAGLPGQQVHHTGREIIMFHKLYLLECQKKFSNVVCQGNSVYLGLSSVAMCFTKDRKSEQKFIQTVGFQQLCSFCPEEQTEKVKIY